MAVDTLQKLGEDPTSGVGFMKDAADYLAHILVLNLSKGKRSSS